jgi:hypothetical protein
MFKQDVSAPDDIYIHVPVFFKWIVFVLLIKFYLIFMWIGLGGWGGGGELCSGQIWKKVTRLNYVLIFKTRNTEFLFFRSVVIKIKLAGG